MKGKAYRYCIILLLSVQPVISFAQTYKIADTQFRKYLDSAYSYLLDPVSKELIVQQAGKIKGSFYLVQKGIENLDGIQYFTGVDSLYIFKNKLTSVPDLSALTNLKVFECYGNKITKLPSFSKLIKLQRLNASDNNLIEFPDIQNLTQLKQLVIFRNQLTSVPDLTQFTRLEELNCYENKLTSIGKVPSSLKMLLVGDNQLTQLPDISAAVGLQYLAAYTNRITSIPDLSQYTSLKTLNLGTNRLTSLPVSLSGMTWLNELVLDNNLLTALPNLSQLNQLTTCKINGNELTFEDVIPSSANPVFSKWNVVPQDSAEEGLILRMREGERFFVQTSIDNHIPSLEYTWFFNGTVRQKSSSRVMEVESVKKSDAGIYYCKITSKDPVLSNFEINTKATRLQVLDESEKGGEISLTPNGDGKDDEMFFPEQGRLTVYDSKGKLIDQFQAPAYWSGTTQSGKELGTGFYLVQINDEATYRITIIR